MFKQKKAVSRLKSIAIVLAAAATVFALVSTFINIMTMMPIYVFDLGDIKAQSPSDVQAECRSDHSVFEKLSKEHPDCSFVWCGDSRLYLVRDSGLRLSSADFTDGFISVKFLSRGFYHVTGYIIDPTKHPSELGRIHIDTEDKLDYASVSMSVRVAMRDGKLDYENAAYLWAEGSRDVIVIEKDSYKPIGSSYAIYTDDGNRSQLMRLLDTDLSKKK